MVNVGKYTIHGLFGEYGKIMTRSTLHGMGIFTYANSQVPFNVAIFCTWGSLIIPLLSWLIRQRSFLKSIHVPRWKNKNPIGSMGWENVPSQFPLNVTIFDIYYLKSPFVTSIFESRPPKTRPKLQPKTRVFWGSRCIYIYISWEPKTFMFRCYFTHILGVVKPSNFHGFWVPMVFEVYNPYIRSVRIYGIPNPIARLQTFSEVWWVFCCGMFLVGVQRSHEKKNGLIFHGSSWLVK